MSYDLELIDLKTGKVLELDEPHYFSGGTFQVGGTTELRYNITYNYAKIFYPLLGEKGIRFLYGQTGEQVIPILEQAIAKLDGTFFVPELNEKEKEKLALLEQLRDAAKKLEDHESYYAGFGGIPIEKARLLKSIEHFTSEETLKVENNYWKCTEENVKKALTVLLEMSKLRPEGIWQGD